MFGGFETPITTNYNEKDTYSKCTVEDSLNVKDSFGEYPNCDSGLNAGIGGHRFTPEPPYHVNDKADERVALSEVITNERPCMLIFTNVSNIHFCRFVLSAYFNRHRREESQQRSSSSRNLPRSRREPMGSC